MHSSIEAKLPVTDSHGFIDEIRKKTHGLVNPILEVLGWQMLQEDPFFVPTDQKDLEKFGASVDKPNLAKKFINMTRKRKGLITDEVLIESGNKQDNRSKKK